MKLEAMIDEDIAIHCESLQEAMELFEFLDSKGKKWINGYPLMKNQTNWEKSDGGTCYNLKRKGLQFSSYNFYNGLIPAYKIINYKNFMESNTSILSMKNRLK